MGKKVSRNVLPPLLAVLACVAAFSAGKWVRSVFPGAACDIAMAAETSHAVSKFMVRKVVLDGRQAGEVVAGDQQIATLVAPAGGLTGYERALIVADRLNNEVAAGVKPENFNYRLVGDMAVLLGGPNTNILTITGDDARRAGVSLSELAVRWTSAVRVALGGAPLPAGSEGLRPVAATIVWRPSEPYGDKYVPILSLLSGLRIGIARVNGPKRQLHLVQAVAQFELRFRDFLNIDVYVPISTRKPGRSLSRVQSVGVTGLGDLRL